MSAGATRAKRLAAVLPNPRIFPALGEGTDSVSGDGGSRLDTGQRSDASVQLRWDDRTTVEYRQSYYDPTALERGDEIEIDTRGTAGGLYAEAIRVLYDSRAGR